MSPPAATAERGSDTSGDMCGDVQCSRSAGAGSATTEPGRDDLSGSTGGTPSQPSNHVRVAAPVRAVTDDGAVYRQW
jgi:hypothetical protein